MHVPGSFRAALGVVLGLPLLLTLDPSPREAVATPLSPALKDAIDKHIVTRVPLKSTLTIADGDTVIFDVEKTVKRSAIRGALTDYEALVSGVISRPGIIVHPRADSLSLEPRRSDVVVRMQCVLHVEPGTTVGGNVRFDAVLVERQGLANVLAKVPVRFKVRVGRSTAKPADAVLEFLGYRAYAVEALALQNRLNSHGLAVTIKTEGNVPSLARSAPEDVTMVAQFIRARNRMWASYRHLTKAAASPDAETQALAKRLLAALTKSETEFPPEVTRLLHEGDDEAHPSDRSAGSSGAGFGGPGPGGTSSRRDAETSGSSPGGSSSRSDVKSDGRGDNGNGARSEDGTLRPLSSYEPGSESESRSGRGSERRSREARGDERGERGRRGEGGHDGASEGGGASSQAPRSPVVTVPPQGSQGSSEGGRGDIAVPAGDVETVFDGRPKKVPTLPAYGRGLVLDDSNIAYAASLRLTWASVQFRESATASAFFFQGQAAITPDFGAELTVPLEYVNLDVDRARSVLALGNPLLALKYRFNLPDVEGRRPAVTLRARWAVPLSPLHSIAPTSLGAEEFSREAHFTDTYAFFLEKTAVGFGASGAWSYDMFQFGAQFYADYFLPVQSSSERTSFLTLQYGASVGVFPFGDVVGAFLEGRATSLLVGPRRTELFAYFGLRAHVFDVLEPALFIGLPIGSVSDVTGLQFGFEMAFSYDVEAFAEAPMRRRSEEGSDNTGLLE